MSAGAASQQEQIARQIDRQRRHQNYSLLRIYNYYRVVIGAALLAAFLTGIGMLGQLRPEAFRATVLAYIAVNLTLAVLTPLAPRSLVERSSVAYALSTADILALTLLMYFSGGVGSGIGTLSIVSVAAGSILVQGRISTTLAATATIVILYEEFYLSLAVPRIGADYFNAGILGAAYFLSSIGLQVYSRRLRRSEITSMERAAEVAALERLNHQIIQRMHTGIAVVTPDATIRLINRAARRLMGLEESEPTPAKLPRALATELCNWQSDNDHRATPMAIADGGPLVRVTFSPVAGGESEIIAFIEDSTELAHQAQQLKLAALGRLSASIAHEIRNPLGAISHAAQLLRESEHLDNADRRLADIIEHHSRRMNAVIENVLELSRRRAPEPEVIEVAGWLADFARGFAESSADAVEIETHVEPPELVLRGDRGQLTQVLTNLVQNGLRYSRKKTGRGWISLRAGIDLPTGRPCLEIIDAGEGVDEDKVANLFEPFYTTESSGTGLGLYISRELCEMNQSRLSYRRAATGGSCFRIVFPHPKRKVSQPTPTWSGHE